MVSFNLVSVYFFHYTLVEMVYLIKIAIVHIIHRHGCLVNIKHNAFQIFSLQVMDTGQGIDPQEIPLVFTKFVKPYSSSSQSGSGAGLGLAICKRYACDLLIPVCTVPCRISPLTNTCDI